MYNGPEKPLGTTSQSVIVDRLLAGLPSAVTTRIPTQPSPRAVATHRPAATIPFRQTARFTRDTRRHPESTVGAWGRVMLALVAGIAITFWPYRMCGLPIAGYFAGTTVVLVAAVWGAAASWSKRAPIAHIVSLGVFIWALALAGDQLLQRTGYASVSASWTCSG